MKKRLLLGFVCAIILFILMISTDSEPMDISCYCEPSRLDSLPPLNPDAEPASLKQGKNIFFHETTCFDEGVSLNARQGCAVESAARMNPNTNVYLLFTSNAKLSNRSLEIFKQLTAYPNVKIRHIFPEEYVRDTPLEHWYTSGVLKKSKWPRSHMSDILRYLTLWKYGGIYLDLDVVVVTSLDGMANFAGAEDWAGVAAGVMGFGKDSVGRHVANLCIRDLKKNFRGDLWGNNGPGVITRTLKKICATNTIRDMTSGRCRGFTVYPPSAFYPIHYKKWKQYFETKDKNDTMRLVENATAIHVWNKLSRDEPVRVDSDVPYAMIARKYCPKVFNNCGKTF